MTIRLETAARVEPDGTVPAAPEPLRVPESAMLGIGRDFADLYGAHLETPRSFLYFAFLTYLGAAVSRKVTLASVLTPEPRLYTVLIGESADTRKSTALRMADEFFRSLTGEPGVLYGVGSAEGIAAELKECPSLLLHFDELKSFVDKAKNEHSVALPMVSTLFERGDYDNRTKTERLSVRGASLSLLAACTVDTYASMFDRRFFAIGFLNRLWLVTDRATSRIPIPRPMPTDMLDALRERLRVRLRDVDGVYTMNGLRAVAYSLTSGAERIFNDWYAARTGSIFERRLDTYGHRLMLLLAVSTGRRVVDEQIAVAAVELLDYQLAVRRESDPVDAENAIAALEEKIRRALARGAVTGRELKRKVNYQRTGVWAWSTAIANLIGAQEIAVDRAQDAYFLRPEPAGVITSVITPKNGNFVNADGN